MINLINTNKLSIGVLFRLNSNSNYFLLKLLFSDYKNVEAKVWALQKVCDYNNRDNSIAP